MGNRFVRMGNGFLRMLQCFFGMRIALRNRAFVENDLQLEPQFLDHIKSNGFVRLPGGDDAAPDRQRRNAPRLQDRWQILPTAAGASTRSFFKARRVENCTILSDDLVENFQSRKYALEVGQFAASYQNQLPAGIFSFLIASWASSETVP